VWPRAGSTQRYSDPVDTARGFALEFLGFGDVVTGPYRAGDSRSGEVDVRPKAVGPTTTVLVRQLDSSGDWWVIGSATNDIQLASPTALDTVASPAHLTGTSTAFEAQVSVRIYADGTDAPIAQSYFMGGSMGEMGPFDTYVDYPDPHASTGTIVLYTVSMENGTTLEASAIRVRFAS
jgi:hypothetical protein